MTQNSDVYINKWSLKTLIVSVVEVYPRETMGLLWGTNRRRELAGKNRNAISVKTVYPIQTVSRKFTNVD
jgi:hypothetical protein